MSEMKLSHEGAAGAAHVAKAVAFPAWKVGLLALAGTMVCGGVALHFFGGSAGSSTEQPAATAPGDKGEAGKLVGHGFLPDGFPETKGSEPAPRVQAEAQDPLVPPALVRGGVGFFIGFAIGYALRSLFRLSMLVVGGLFLLVFLLNYLKVVTVDWQLVQTQLQSWGGAIENQLGDFKTFVLGSLPAIGISAVGVFAGFKKH